MIRYRRSIDPPTFVPTIIEEEWEELTDGSLQFIKTLPKVWKGQLKPHERQCLDEGWTPPDFFIYVESTEGYW